MNNLGTIFSPQMENLIIQKFEKLFEQAITAKLKEEDIITQKEVIDKYDITHGTLMKWEKLGLSRFQPPIENTTSIYYRKSEINKFLGMN